MSEFWQGVLATVALFGGLMFFGFGWVGYSFPRWHAREHMKAMQYLEDHPDEVRSASEALDQLADLRRALEHRREADRSEIPK